MSERSAHKPRFRALLGLGGSRAASIGLQALYLPLLARSLGVSAFGVHAATLSAAYIGLMFIDFGLGVRALRLSAETRTGTARAMLRLRLVSVLPLTVIGALIALAAPHGAGDRLLVIAATLVMVSGDTAFDLGIQVMIGQQQRISANSLLILRRLVILTSFAWGVNETNGLISLAVAGVSGLVVVFVLMLLAPRGDATALEVMRGSLRYWATTLSTNAQQADALLIGALTGQRMAGLYGASIRISNPLAAPVAVLLQLVIPEMSATSDREHRKSIFRDARRLITLYSVVLVAAAPFAQQLTRWYLGEKFLDAAPILGGVLISAAIAAFGQLELAWHVADGLPKQLPGRLFGAVVVGLVALSVGAVVAGTYGAAAGLVLGNILVLGVLIWTRAHVEAERREEVSALGRA